MDNYQKHLVSIEFYSNEKGICSKIKKTGDFPHIVDIYSKSPVELYLPKLFRYIVDVLNFTFDSHKFVISFGSNSQLQEFYDLISEGRLDFVSKDFCFDTKTAYYQNHLHDFLPIRGFNLIDFPERR